jgi:hypothetical protein
LSRGGRGSRGRKKGLTEPYWEQGDNYQLPQDLRKVMEKRTAFALGVFVRVEKDAKNTKERV